VYLDVRARHPVDGLHGRELRQRVDDLRLGRRRELRTTDFRIAVVDRQREVRRNLAVGILGEHPQGGNADRRRRSRPAGDRIELLVARIDEIQREHSLPGRLGRRLRRRGGRGTGCGIAARGRSIASAAAGES
jgi:hypothetical protein